MKANSTTSNSQTNSFRIVLRKVDIQGQMVNLQHQTPQWQLVLMPGICCKRKTEYVFMWMSRAQSSCILGALNARNWYANCSYRSLISYQFYQFVTPGIPSIQYLIVLVASCCLTLDWFFYSHCTDLYSPELKGHYIFIGFWLIYEKAASHNLNQYWPGPVTPYGVTKSLLVNSGGYNL